MKIALRRRAPKQYAPLCTFPICAALAAAPANAQDSLKPLFGQQAPPKINAVGTTINEIVVLGNKNLNADYIRSSSGHKVGDVCNETVLEEMRENLLKTGNFGVFIAEQAVQVRSEETAGKPGCKVIIQVEENPQIDWKTSVNISGSGPVPPEEIKALIRPSTVFNLNQFRTDLSAIENKYSSLGYRATIAADEILSPDKPNTLNLRVIVLRVNKITIARNKRTRDVTIRRELRTKEGDFSTRMSGQKTCNTSSISNCSTK